MRGIKPAHQLLQCRGARDGHRSRPHLRFVPGVRVHCAPTGSPRSKHRPQSAQVLVHRPGLPPGKEQEARSPPNRKEDLAYMKTANPTARSNSRAAPAQRAGDLFEKHCAWDFLKVHLNLGTFFFLTQRPAGCLPYQSRGTLANRRHHSHGSLVTPQAHPGQTCGDSRGTAYQQGRAWSASRTDATKTRPRRGKLCETRQACGTANCGVSGQQPTAGPRFPKRAHLATRVGRAGNQRPRAELGAGGRHHKGQPNTCGVAKPPGEKPTDARQIGTPASPIQAARGGAPKSQEERSVNGRGNAALTNYVCPAQTSRKRRTWAGRQERRVPLAAGHFSECGKTTLSSACAGQHNEPQKLAASAAPSALRLSQQRPKQQRRTPVEVPEYGGCSRAPAG